MRCCRRRTSRLDPGRFLRSGSHADESNTLLRPWQKRRGVAGRFAARRQRVVCPHRGDRDGEPHERKKHSMSEACVHGRSFVWSFIAVAVETTTFMLT